MTVRELIDALSGMDPDSDAVIITLHSTRDIGRVAVPDPGTYGRCTAIIADGIEL